MDQRLIFCVLLLFLFTVPGCQLVRIAPVSTVANAAAPTLTQGPSHTPWPAFQTQPPLPTRTAPPPPTRAPTGTPFPSATPTPVILGAIDFPPDVNPLTGLKVTEASRLDRRPIMIKVSNFPRTGRPHAGLSAADLVFEYYIGEFENRFVALYYGQDATRVGPLRSGRLVDAQLASMYGAILVYGNADPRVDKVLVDQLGTRAITFDDAPCPPICGKDTHTVEGVFVDSAATTRFAVQEKITNARPDLRGMVFDLRLPTSKVAGTFLGVEFGPQNRGEWRYDSASGSYLRWIEQERSTGQFVQVPLVDRNTGEQLTFQNVIVIFSRYTELLPTMFEMEMSENFTGQRALYFRDGLVMEGSWRSNGPDRPISLLNSWGSTQALKPGKSWIIIVGLSSIVTQPAPGRWELEFHTK